MGIMKSKAGMLAMLGMGLVMMGTGYDNPFIEPKESEEDRKKRLAKAEVKRNKRNGLKEFYFGENSLWALNQKSADKKARSKGWIKQEG